MKKNIFSFLTISVILTSTIVGPSAEAKEKKMANAKEEVRSIAPEFIKLTDDLLFGDIWKRPGISNRDKSLVTITTLAVLGRTDQLSFHLGFGLDNGLKQEEIVAALTHVAFYAGWPAAMASLQKFKEVIDERKKPKDK